MLLYKVATAALGSKRENNEKSMILLKITCKAVHISIAKVECRMACSLYNFCYESDFQIFMVLSFSRAPDAMIFSVGWHAEQRTTSEKQKCHFRRSTVPVYSGMRISSTSNGNKNWLEKLGAGRIAVCNS